MFNHLVIEGSSSAETYSDESGKSGFTGRLNNHLREYCEETKRRNNWGTIDGWTHISNFAQPGRALPEWAPLIGSHMNENFQRSPYKQQVHRLGIFVLEGHPLFLENRYDTTHLQGRSLAHVWRDSLEHVKEQCADRNVRALFVQMPPPERTIGERGHQIHRQLSELAIRTCNSMDGDAEFVSVEDMLHGHDIEPFLADDRMHPNSRGHELIYRHILPKVYEKFEMEQREPFPDPAELFEDHILVAN